MRTVKLSGTSMVLSWSFWRRAVRPRSVAIAELAIITLLLTAHLALRWPDSPIARVAPAGLVALVDLDRERNLPAVAAGLMALGSSVALVAIARRQGRRGWCATRWRLLAWVAALIAADEFLALHEAFTPLGAAVAGREHLVLVWVLVVTLMIAAIGMLGLGALPTFEPRGRALLAAGALLYLAGGLALDAASSQLSAVRGADSRAAIAVTTLEELIELIGLALVLYALVRHLAAGGSRRLGQRGDPKGGRESQR